MKDRNVKKTIAIGLPIVVLLLLLALVLPKAYQLRQYNNLMRFFGSGMAVRGARAITQYYAENHKLPKNLDEINIESPHRIRAATGNLYLSTFYDPAIDLRTDASERQIIFATYNPLDSVQWVVLFNPRNKEKPCTFSEISTEELKQWYQKKIKAEFEERYPSRGSFTTCY